MRALVALVLALCLCTPCQAVDAGRRKQALPEDVYQLPFREISEKYGKKYFQAIEFEVKR